MKIDLMMNCIVGLKIYHKYLSSLVLNGCSYWSNWPYMMSIVPFVWNLTLFSALLLNLFKLCDFSPKWWRTLAFVNITSTICSFCMELKLFSALLFNLFKLCDFSPKWWRTLVFVNITSTVPFVWNLSCFQHYCSTHSNYVTLPPNGEEL